MIGVFSWDTCRRLPHPHPEERQESAALPPASASSASATNTLQKSSLKDCYVRLVRIDIQAARHTAMTDQADKEAQQTSPSDNTPDSPTQHQATPEQYEVERSPLKRRTRRGRPRKACLDTSVESGAFNQEAKQRRRNTRHVKKRRKSLEVEVEEEEEDEPLQRKIRPVFPSHISKRQPRGRRGGRACRGIANFNERMKDGVCRGVMSSDDEDEAENKSNAGHSSGEESHRSECLFSMTNTTPEKEHNTNSRMSERQETTHSSHPDQPTQQEQADWDTAKRQPQTHTPRGKGRQPDIYTPSPEDSEDTTTLKQADKDTTFQRHREMNISGHLEDTRRREGKETTPKPQQASTLTGKPSQPSHLSRQDSYCQASAQKCPLFVSPPLSGHSVRSEKKEPYSVHEDVDIVVYIDAFEEYHRLGGREMWQEMEHYFNHRRTWQSLKERFRKRIAPNLCVYVKLGLSRKVVDRMKHNIAIEYETGRRQRKSRKPFTVEEDRGILHFISSNHRFREVGGVIMWKEMASSCCELDNHTWHSLKQRFHKQILPNLRKYKLSRNTVLQLQSKKRIPKLDRVSASESDSSPDYIRKRKGSATPQQEAATKRRAKHRDTTDLDSDSSYPEVLSRPRHTYKSGKELKGRLTQGNRVSVPCTYKSKRKSRKVRDEEKSDTNFPPLVYRSKSKLRKVRDKEESDTDSLPLSYRSRSKSEQVRDEDERETDVFIPNTHLLERSGRVRGEGESEGGNDSPHKSRKKERRGRVREECEEESDNGSISHTHKSRKEKRERLRDESEGESDDEAILSTYKSKKKEKERQRDDSEEENDRFNPHTLRFKKKRKRRSAENEDVDDPNPYTHKSKKERRQRISDKTEEESDDDEDYVDNSMSRTGSKKSRRGRGRDESEEGSEDSDHPYSLVYPHLKKGRGRRQLLEVEHTMEMFEHTRKPQERTERTENTPKSNQRSIKEFLKAGRKGTSHSNSLTRRHRGREEEDEEEEEMDDDEEEVEEAEEVEVLEDEVVARFLTHQEYNKHENNTTSNTTKHCSFLKSIRKPLYSQDFTADISPKTPFRNNTLHSRRRLTRKEPEETSAIDTETEGKVDTVEDDDGDSVHSLTLDIMPDVKKRVQERREKANVCEKDMMEVLEDVPEKEEEEEEEEDMLSLSLDFSVERNKCSQRKVTQEREKKEDIPQEVIEEEEEDVSVVEEEELEKEDDMPDRVIEEHEEEEEVEEVSIAEVIEKDEEEEEVEEEIPQEEVVEHEVEEEKEDEIPLEVIEEDEEEKEDDNLQEKLTQEQEEKEEDKQNKIQEEERRKKEDDKQNKTQEDEGKKGDDKPNKVTQEHEEEEEDDNIPNKMQKHEKEKEHNTSVEVIEEEKEEDMPHKAQEHEEGGGGG
ncbi:trichohyalin-like isoform X2 [Portunus trituberculatus]|nr:trichohyalin-like isoform X2 [Portunus trituberculatus]XP_045105574.1 trichohyalin-like isoform X2 [Portunus trituberculatus]XP_045105575.1 trichohyalin-like isoform X2 [Portunus trituberculatus]XP_045105576.1 trichohyalin-like isoform X2 [Portunus trituberculatus]